jgi:hypothetical protein
VSGEPQTNVLNSPALTDPGSRTVQQTTVLPQNTNDNTRPLAKRKSSQLIIALVAVIAVIAIVGIYFYARTNKTTAIESIAVLPLENKSGNADSDYLCDGLAESLIYRLSQLPDLKVSPANSVFRYKGKAADIKTIARELGVSAVMVGRL